MDLNFQECFGPLAVITVAVTGCCCGSLKDGCVSEALQPKRHRCSKIVSRKTFGINLH